MKSYLFIIWIILLSGCTKVMPPITQYRVSAKEFDIKFSNTKCHDKTLKIQRVFASPILMSRNMSYVELDNKEYNYSQSQWSQSPNTALSYEILQHIRDAQIYKNVIDSQSQGISDVVLEINIDDFMQYFNKSNTKSYAKVKMSFTLIDMKSAKVIASKSFDAIVETKTLDAEGGVDALNKSFEHVMFDSIKWLAKVCK